KIFFCSSAQIFDSAAPFGMEAVTTVFAKTENNKLNAISMFKSCALSLTIAASLAAQTTTAPGPKSAPWDDVDAAKAQQAKDPLGADGLRYATANKLQLGAGPDDSFAVVNANRDDLGNVHVRMQQYYKGVKVLHGQIISHANARGGYSQFTNSLKKGIGI